MHEVWQPELKKKPRDERGFERPVSGGALGTEEGRRPKPTPHPVRSGLVSGSDGGAGKPGHA